MPRSGAGSSNRSGPAAGAHDVGAARLAARVGHLEAIVDYAGPLDARPSAPGADTSPSYSGEVQLGLVQKDVDTISSKFTGVAISSEDDDTEATLSGGAFTLGGGAHYVLSPKLALDVNLAYSGGQFTTIEVDGEENDDLEWDMSTFRIRAGIMYFFNRR